jgi:hypothetical protein
MSNENLNFSACRFHGFFFLKTNFQNNSKQQEQPNANYNGIPMTLVLFYMCYCENIRLICFKSLLSNNLN